jgi:hypothetical protein
MSGSIRLHPEHGLNPKLVRCAACGKDTGEIIMLGIRDYIDVCQDYGLKRSSVKFVDLGDGSDEKENAGGLHA